MDDALEQRVDALERTITGDEVELTELTTEADALDRLGTVEDRVEELEEEVAELAAATQALRGYVGNIRSVNEAVEQRADTALAKAEALERARSSEACDVDCPSETSQAEPGREQPAVTAQQGPLPKQSSTPSEQGETAEQSHVAAAQANEAPSASADGGRPQGTEESSTERCHACGRRHDADAPNRQPNDQPTPSAADHNDARRDHDLVPEGETDTGTLRRIRDLL